MCQSLASGTGWSKACMLNWSDSRRYGQCEIHLLQLTVLRHGEHMPNSSMVSMLYIHLRYKIKHRRPLNIL